MYGSGCGERENTIQTDNCQQRPNQQRGDVYYHSAISFVYEMCVCVCECTRKQDLSIVSACRVWFVAQRITRDVLPLSTPVLFPHLSPNLSSYSTVCSLSRMHCMLISVQLNTTSSVCGLLVEIFKRQRDRERQPDRGSQKSMISPTIWVLFKRYSGTIQPCKEVHNHTSNHKNKCSPFCCFMESQEIGRASCRERV